MENSNVRACPSCGGATFRHRAYDGAIFFTPVDDMRLLDLMKAYSSDDLTYDRLRRAERIITDLRAEVKALKSNDRSL